MPAKPRFGAPIFRAIALGAIVTPLFGSAPRPVRAQETPAAKTAPLRLGYRFKAGETYRYKVTGLFDGHFPPFATPGSTPVHVVIALDYAARVLKEDAQGAEVAFHVEQARLVILKTAPGADWKLPPEDDQSDWPLPVEQIQAALDVKAVLRPDGSVASVTGGDNNANKINIGVDLRKLFLLMLPVTFPDNPVKLDDAWTFADGLLGTNQGKTTYNARLTSVKSGPKEIAFRCAQNAETIIDDRKDGAGKPTVKPADAVDTTEGKATLKGDFSFTAPAKPDAKTGRSAARLQEGRFTLVATLTHRRTVPDPDNPDAPLVTPIDITARFIVQLTPSSRKGGAPANATGLK